MTDSGESSKSVVPAQQTYMPHQNLIFIEEAIPKFSGTDPTYTVNKWAQEVEDNAEIFGLSPTQKLLIARRTLTSTAAAWLRTEKTFKTYEELKSALNKEFPDHINTKEIHEMMSKRKKRTNETCYDYMLEMKALGKRGKLADYVAIEYIVEGIIDDESNKMMLYGITTYSDLKEKLKLYESFKQNKKHSARPSSAVVSNQNKKIVRCYSCGVYNHTSSECPHREKGRKCFRCNEFGHIGSQCNANASRGSIKQTRDVCDKGRSTLSTAPSVKQMCVKLAEVDQYGGSQLSQSGSDVDSPCSLNDLDEVYTFVNHDKNINNNKSVKDVKICNRTITSLIDSGSDLNLISTKLFFDLQITSFEKEDVTLTGLGVKRVNSLGKFKTIIELDGQTFETVFHIVPHDVIPYNLLLGQELLCNIVLIMSKGTVKIMPQSDSCWLNKICCVADGLGQPKCLVSDPRIKHEVQQLVDNYVPVKTKESPIEMKIILTDEIPVAQRPRRLSIIEQKEVDKQIGACPLV